MSDGHSGGGVKDDEGYINLIVNALAWEEIVWEIANEEP